MSINRVKNIPELTPTTGIERLPNPSATLAVQAKASVSSQPTESDGSTQSPLPARFPWMNRLTRQLEPTATQRAAFPAAPALGDHLDQSA